MTPWTLWSACKVDRVSGRCQQTRTRTCFNMTTLKETVLPPSVSTFPDPPLTCPQSVYESRICESTECGGECVGLYLRLPLSNKVPFCPLFAIHYCYLAKMMHTGVPSPPSWESVRRSRSKVERELWGPIELVSWVVYALMRRFRPWWLWWFFFPWEIPQRLPGVDWWTGMCASIVLKKGSIPCI